MKLRNKLVGWATRNILEFAVTLYDWSLDADNDSALEAMKLVDDSFEEAAKYSGTDLDIYDARDVLEFTDASVFSTDDVVGLMANMCPEIGIKDVTTFPGIVKFVWFSIQAKFMTWKLKKLIREN